jgi:hypothetical protein
VETRRENDTEAILRRFTRNNVQHPTFYEVSLVKPPISVFLAF